MEILIWSFWTIPLLIFLISVVVIIIRLSVLVVWLISVVFIIILIMIFMIEGKLPWPVWLAFVSWIIVVSRVPFPISVLARTPFLIVSRICILLIATNILRGISVFSSPFLILIFQIIFYFIGMLTNIDLGRRSLKNHYFGKSM